MCDDNQINLDGECIKKTTVVMNHLITNPIEAFHFLVMVVMVFVLYFYQCTKINNYAKSNNKYIGFQVLFYTLTLVRIIQLSYAYVGYEIDQQSNEWNIDGKKLIYCDPSLQYDGIQGICYDRYEINGIFQNLYLYLGTIALQMISFFWQKQISPVMFISVYKVLLNQYVTLSTKLQYLLFIFIDITMLVCQIAVWITSYNDSAFQILHIFQLVFVSLTTLNLLQNIYKQHQSGVHIQSHTKLFILLAIFIQARTIFLYMRLFTFDYFKVNEQLKKISIYHIQSDQQYIQFLTCQNFCLEQQ